MTSKLPGVLSRIPTSVWRKLGTVAGTLGILGFGFFLIAFMGSQRPEPERQEAEPRLPAAFVEEVAYAPVTMTVRAQGEVRPRNEIALVPQVSGRIVEVSDDFIDGGVIEEGELLVRLEDADYRSNLTRARARVAQAEQALAVERAEASLAARDYRELSGEDADPSDLTLRRPQLARAEADLDAAKADLADAELAMERTRIRAPFTGRVRSTSADTGQFVQPGVSIGRVFSTDLAEVRLPLADQDLARLSLPFAFEAEYGEGPKVSFTGLAAGKERRWTGYVVRTDAAIDPTTRQIAAIAQVRDPYGEGMDRVTSEDGFPMAIGLFVDAEIAGPRIPRAVVVPRLAVTNTGEVFVVAEDGTVEAREVQVAATSPEGVIVTGGLAPGERIITGRSPVADGGKVKPLTPSEAVSGRTGRPESPDRPESEDTGASPTAAGAVSGGSAGAVSTGAGAGR
jgi:RND family efflux transporter MFP subunit